MVFAITAPKTEFHTRRAEMVRMLRSFQFTKADSPRSSGGGTAPAGPSVSWAKWTDPTEGSLSLQCPQGWKIQGGVSRQFSTVWPVIAVRMTSPDGRTLIGLNDHSVPPYTMPGGLTQEGTWYTPGYGTRMFVLRFIPGVNYAEFYARNFLLRGSVFSVVDRRDRADLVQYQNQLNRQYAVGDIQTQSTAGEASFTFDRSGQPSAGYVMASTDVVASASMGGGIWTVKGLFYFLAPVDQASATQSILSQVVRSIRINPQWFYANLKMTGDISRIVAETNEYISKLQSDSYWSRQRAQDRAAQNFSDYIRGVQRVRDPESGEVYEARSGYNYYYQVRGDPSNPIGTNTTDIERVLDVTPLEKVD